jgi:2-methylcitrate dehydratase PrpD
MYKPYPHCRILHGPIDCITKLVEENDIRPAEIEGIKVWVEAFVEQPVWMTRDVRHVHDAQFSIAHGMATAAHRFAPGKDWLDPKNVFSPSVMSLMQKVEHVVHPDYVKQLSAHPSARPSRVEVRARGRTFVAESLYPKGSPSPDPASRMSDEDLVRKFCHNAAGVLPAAAIDATVNAVMTLEKSRNFAAVMRLVGV